MYLRKGDAMKNRLEELRKQRDIKQEDLANSLEVSCQTIGALEMDTIILLLY